MGYVNLVQNFVAYPTSLMGQACCDEGVEVWSCFLMERDADTDDRLRELPLYESVAKRSPA